MPVDLIVIESGLVVNDEVDQFLFTDGGQDRIFNQLREVPARVDLGPAPGASTPTSCGHPATQTHTRSASDLA